MTIVHVYLEQRTSCFERLEQLRGTYRLLSIQLACGFLQSGHLNVNLAEENVGRKPGDEHVQGAVRTAMYNVVHKQV